MCHTCGKLCVPSRQAWWVPLCFAGSDVRLFLTPHMMHPVGGCWQQRRLQHMLAYRRMYVPYMWKAVCAFEAGLVYPLVLCRVRCEVVSDTACDASGWWMLAAAAVAAHVGIQEDVCAIHVENCVFLRSGLGAMPSITISTPGWQDGQLAKHTWICLK